MIGIILDGRLGNQLFQYAFGYASAKKMGVKFYIETRPNEYLVHRYFEVNQEAFNFLEDSLFLVKRLKSLFNRFVSHRFYMLTRKLLGLTYVDISSDYPPALELPKIKNKCIYFGYYQSEAYFIDYKDEIIQQFTIRVKFKLDFEKVLSTIKTQQKKVVVHVRRTDYIENKYDLPMSYFHEALSKVNGDDNFYIFISDDTKFVETEFGMIKNKYISTNTEIIDFQFLMCADICILSNSSFSWWGAYLNPNHPKVFAPQYWLGINEKCEYPVEVIPKSWSIIKI